MPKDYDPNKPATKTPAQRYLERMFPDENYVFDSKPDETTDGLRIVGTGIFKTSFTRQRRRQRRV